MATDTYGFGSSEPSRDTGPARDGDSTSTNEGTDQAPIVMPLDGEYTDNIRGQSPVNGLMSGDPDCNSDWEVTSIHPSSTSNVSTATGTGNTLGGSWPLPGSVLNPSLSREVGSEDSDWTGHKPGTA